MSNRWQRIGVVALVALVALWPLIIVLALSRMRTTADSAPAYVVFFVLLWLLWLVPAAALFRWMQRELAEALEQQKATSDVLGVISRSPGDLEPVFQTILANATRICGARVGNLFLYENGAFTGISTLGATPAYVEYLASGPIVPGPGTGLRRIIDTKQTIHVQDARNEDAYFESEPLRIATADLLGARSFLNVPMLKDGELIGAIGIYRSEVRPFTDKQVELVTNFARQAVIAIENVRLFNEIRDKTGQLEIANKYKSHFIASASHDLRQPLHALNLFVAQLRAETDPDERSRLVARVEAAVGSMNELFGALLDMTRLDAGILEPNVADFPIARLFKRIESTFADAARGKGLKLRIVSSGAWLRTDAILLERMLLNLVSNAVRYTTQCGIVIGCRRRGDGIRIDVCDTGPGIPDDQQRKVFGEFYQFAAQRSGSGAGLGLGLAIVDRLGQLLGVDVDLDSRMGRGSRFSITVPLAARREAEGRPTVPQTHADPAQGKLVLVIDDDPLVLDGMGGTLRSWGCSVVGADAPDTLLAQLGGNARVPDLIISDYRLAGGGTGIAAIEQLRNALGAAIPAFLISGDTAPERLRDASARGFQLLHKPVPPIRLRAMVNQLLKPRGEGATAPAPAAE